MKKLVNHVDHVAYISRWETVESYVAQLEGLTGAKMERSEHFQRGSVVYVDWSAGLEIVAPMPEKSEINQDLHERLEVHGEGLFATVYGVEDLDEHRANLEAKGFELSELVQAHSDDPWYERILLRERYGPQFMNSWLVFSQIDYPDDAIQFVTVKGRDFTS